jgi:osmoprotectant transport system permease protein
MNHSLISFLIAKLPALAEKTFQQIYLTGLSIILAIVIGIPLGIWAVRTTRIKTAILGFASVLQTIPSIALLAFLIPFMGIGIKPAIITLALYALLPIIRNTVTGIEGVAPDIIEAADGLGFTRWQKLWMVQSPLALPTIIAGIRTATAMAVGIATLAAFIGAGGLGDFIFQGISLNDNRLVLLGAIPAALLALILDYIIGQIEIAIAKRKYKIKSGKAFQQTALTITVVALIALVFAAKPLSNLWLTPQNSVRIATKNFTEQYILGYLMADMIEAKTKLKVDKKFNLGSTDICHRAMLKNEIDIYPEYTGTAYVVVLKRENPGNAAQVFQQVKSDYLQKFNIVWLEPFGFNNTQALAVRQDFATQHNLQTISDLVPLAKNLSIGVPAEFMERADAFPGLKKAYGLEFGQVRQMDPGLMYEAIKNEKVDAIMAFSTDGRIANYHLKILTDDKHFFPPYYAAPLVRNEVLQAHPEILTALQPLSGLIDDKTMQQLNYQVDVEKQTPEDVAKNFLISKGLL